MLYFKNNVGRLLEVRPSWPVSLEEVQQFVASIREVLLRHEQVVAVVDVRSADVFPKPIADAFIGVMKHDNPKMVRSAFIVGEKAILGIQMERFIREAGNPMRRAFRDAAEAERWVGEALEEAERTRVGAFISEGAA